MNDKIVTIECIGNPKIEPYATVKNLTNGLIDMCNEQDRWSVDGDKLIHDTGVWFTLLEPTLEIYSTFTDIVMIIGMGNLTPFKVKFCSDLRPVMKLIRHFELQSIDETIQQVATIVKLTAPA